MPVPGVPGMTSPCSRTPRPPPRRDFGDGAAQPFMSERISHSHSLEQKRLEGSPVRCSSIAQLQAFL